MEPEESNSDDSESLLIPASTETTWQDATIQFLEKRRKLFRTLLFTKIGIFIGLLGLLAFLAVGFPQQIGVELIRTDCSVLKTVNSSLEQCSIGKKFFFFLCFFLCFLFSLKIQLSFFSFFLSFSVFLVPILYFSPSNFCFFFISFF